jgi:hypothetical protein
MLILINLLKAYWKPLAAFLILASLYGYIHVIRSDNASLKATIEANKATAKAQIEANKKEIIKREAITKDVVNSYADSINKVNDYYAKNPTLKFKPFGVCLSPASSRGMPSETDSTKGIDTEANGDTKATATDTAREVQIDMDKLSKEIVQLLELREFELKQDSIK